MLSKTQLQAVSHKDGPAMVLAGPGSGKTLVITNRIQALIRSGVRPETILVITFTRAAALEMRRRFLRLTSPETFRVTFGTFHAVFFQILKQAYHFTGENILRDDERFRILSSVAETLNITAEDVKEWSGDVLAEISRVKSDRIPLDCYYSASCPEEEFRRIYRMYAERLQRAGRIDFDDMMVMTEDLLNSRKDILASWQQHFCYILVDEFQDINLLQYRIVRMLARPQNNLFIVGDDDQAIYRFRGSRPEIMLNFPKDYPDAKVIRLNDNYRSAPQIVSASLAVIRENKSRFDKELRSCGRPGVPVEVTECRDEETQLLYVVNSIRKSAGDGAQAFQIAVLARTNRELRGIAEKLAQFEVHFAMKDTVPVLYDHWIAQDLFAYMRIACEKMRRSDFLRICNRPNRYITRESTDAAKVYLDGEACVSWNGLRAYYQDRAWMDERLQQFSSAQERLKFMKPYAAVNYIRRGIGYDSFLSDYAKKHRIEEEELTAVADELMESAKAFDTFESWQEQIALYRRKMEQIRRESAQYPSGEDDNRVTLATLHSSKGLEFDETFLIDVNEGIVPYRKAALEGDIEEERRLFYVGMTRARKKLHILYVRERYNKKMEPSRFLRPLRELQYQK